MTNNKSFERMFYYLQDNNVSRASAYQILNVYNTKFQDFDIKKLPNVDEISNRTKNEIIFSECKKNIWFFFREIIRLPIPGQPHIYDSSMSFPLNLISLQMIWCYEHHIPFFVCTHGNDYIRNITIKLLWIYDYITKISTDKSSFSILFTNDNDLNLFISQVCEIIAINSDILPRLFTLNVNDIRDRIEKANEQIRKSNITSGVIFGFDVHNYPDLFNIFKLNRENEDKSFFILEANYDKITNNDLKIYTSSLMSRMKLSYLDLPEEDIAVLKTMMLYIYANEYTLGYDAKSVEYRKLIKNEEGDN